MSGPEGWDGRSVREHVKAAKSVADEAMSFAQSNCYDLEELRVEMMEEVSNETTSLSGRLDELEKRAVVLREAPAEPNAETARDLKRASLFPKVKYIREEISCWNHFLVEVREVRAALLEWQTLKEPYRGASQ